MNIMGWDEALEDRAAVCWVADVVDGSPKRFESKEESPASQVS